MKFGSTTFSENALGCAIGHNTLCTGSSIRCTGNSVRCDRSSTALEANNRIRLGPLLALNDIELDLVAFLERFVSIQLNCGVVNEYIRPVFASDESVALGVIEPLDLSFVLSHRFLPSLVRSGNSD